MEDLAGLGKSIDKILDVIARGTGILYEPTKIRRAAEAEAYKIELIADAQAKKHKTLVEAKVEERFIVERAKESLIERAAQRKLHKELTKQHNIENVFALAALDAPEMVTDKPVDPDWLNRFIDGAETVSSETMQKIWARVFVREIEGPGRFSIKSLDFLKKLTKYEADALSKLCQYARYESASGQYIVLAGAKKLNFVASLFSIPNEETIFPYESELELTEWMTLQKIGLVYEEELIKKSLPKGTVLEFDGLKLTTRKKNVTPIFYSLTPLGNEIAQLIDTAVDEEYISTFQKKYKRLALLEPIN
ncbi:TIGR03899 family protein [Vibrio parahaemolyticus]|uniref:TIGR03899 family protein n=1 Tax=Vibrio parahaemolyticus TaxID=670 RepID=UPI001122ECF9|nr:TIGR03899 family protein [Vibrio parahaemolyticus]MCX4136397.1 TIGR03899 family protein [Vibrio parahaemolyticus]MCZ6386878.1 TIGR03899 family protein [Vibrio parahaemolyticus]MDF4866754.1 TIGR03899 family protein [Vibrio parahaemolyticus]MRE01539.1 TIGR03899 family protein [Vibrio parahaemolyticus]TNY95972.1 TIGR03899 family protein [Vibrio parahaemolyticus]